MIKIGVRNMFSLYNKLMLGKGNCRWIGQVVHQHDNDNKSLEYLKMRAVARSYVENLPDFKRGKAYFSKGKYRISRDFFKRSLIKEPVNITEKLVNIYLYQKVAESEANSQNSLEAEHVLDNIITMVKTITTDKNHIFEHYNNLMMHCIIYNLDKAIIIGKSLLTESRKNKIHSKNISKLNLSLGSCYLLDDEIR